MVVAPPKVFPLVVNLARRQITLTLTRDGEVTSNEKVGLLLVPGSLEIVGIFVARDGAQAIQRFLASAVSGPYLLLVTDEVLPRRAAARYPVITQDLVLAVDLNDGTGGGAGLPALLPARVVIDGADAAREVLAVEQQADGEWRVAGHGRTTAGSADLDLRVSGGGRVYALGLDDWGVQFQPGLQVAIGVAIRPTLFQGWLYRVTQAGQLPAVEPEWWDETLTGPQLVGTARAVVVRYYQPQALGPITVEMV